MALVRARGCADASLSHPKRKRRVFTPSWSFGMRLVGTGAPTAPTASKVAADSPIETFVYVEIIRMDLKSHDAPGDRLKKGCATWTMFEDILGC